MNGALNSATIDGKLVRIVNCLERSKAGATLSITSLENKMIGDAGAEKINRPVQALIHNLNDGLRGISEPSAGEMRTDLSRTSFQGRRRD